MTHLRRLILPILLALLVGGLAVWLVDDFSGPLSDGGDTDFYEYVGYYVAHNLTFWPVPHLNLLHNQTFYPYGANHTLLDWGWERDYWYALCYWLFGKGEPGPYLQYYYVYSLLVTALGAFWLLRGVFGDGRAWVAGLIVSVFNFYCIWKYPTHLNVCVLHWTTLCMLATYRLLYECVPRSAPTQPLPPLPWWLLWVWLHVQVLSQELGYVAGFALTFTVLCAPFLAWSLWQRRVVIPGLFRPAPGHKPYIWLLVSLIGISTWLYLPPTIQIFLGAQAYADSSVEMPPSWSHPLRLLIPYLPGVDEFSIRYDRIFRDTYESYGQTRPGLYLIILAVVGFWAIRRKPLLWGPVVLMLGLCVVYHPVLLPTLKVFPWFSFNRHGGRATMVYPLLFGLLALWAPRPQTRAGWLALTPLLVLMLAEWSWGYRYPHLYKPQIVSESVKAYMQTVRTTPGEAVLDFPFCTIGADGVGAVEGLCPYYREQNAVFTFRRFHQKKVVGQYWGRLLPAYIQPFLRDHWDRLLRPGYVFTPADWQFLDRFLQQHRFAGINLYPDLLSAEQRAAFYAHYGPPRAETRLPMAGRVQFLVFRR
ncbi:hypothetical protein [Rudanella lutea]|uniref:hypothetical protein n=1 Tax=Rudanella lutea TaxID=451374 RepID=UPI0005C7059B|nr:hypothetical protein [Rudanella lutea]